MSKEVLILPDNWCIFPDTSPGDALVAYIYSHQQEIYQTFEKAYYGRATKDGWSPASLQDPYQALIERQAKSKKASPVPNPLEGFTLSTCVPVLLNILSKPKEGPDGTPMEEEEEEEEQEAPQVVINLDDKEETRKKPRFTFYDRDELMQFMYTPQFLDIFFEGKERK